MAQRRVIGSSDGGFTVAFDESAEERDQSIRESGERSMRRLEMTPGQARLVESASQRRHGIRWPRVRATA